MDGMLSQDEINALLAGANLEGGVAEEEAEESLTDEQKDALGEVANISMGTAATTLSTLLNQPVNITTPNVSYMYWDDLADSYDRPCVFLSIQYTCGLDGNNVLVLKERDVKIITDLMMGGAGTESEEPISELHLSAIGEAMNQMMGSAATSMSSMLGQKIDISPPVANLIDLNEKQDGGILPSFLNKRFVKVAFRMTIGDLIDSEIMQLYPFDFAENLYETFSASIMGETGAPAENIPSAPIPEPLPAPEPQPAPAPMPDMSQMQQAMPNMGMPQMQPMPGYGMPQMQPMPGYGMPQMQPMPGYGMPQPNVNVQPAAFQAFSGASAAGGHENIDLIMDVPLEVTVELGRTSKSIKEILEFAPGTIVELNKIAGEPIDVLVNGKYVAKGEVVVIEESFGVKITEIIK
ncbi:MAG: flagellar motor switch phosphatase FliY [Butyrivibrio sp.]|nr:flagellar motor switch phosphatase FliY [Butyrivibrio sp.]